MYDTISIIVFYMIFNFIVFDLTKYDRNITNTFCPGIQSQFKFKMFQMHIYSLKNTPQFDISLF